MADTMQIRNKATGEVVTIRRKSTESKPSTISESPRESYVGMVSRVGSDIQKDISQRGDYLDEIAKNMESPSLLRKGLGFVQTAGIPVVALSGAISNPALAMQQGNFNPKDLASEAFKGATLQKQGKIGDVYRGAGVDKNVAGLLGFAVETTAPVMALSKMHTYFGKLTTVSDRKLATAGKTLIDAGKKAVDLAGGKLDDIFSKVDGVVVEKSNDVILALKRLPEGIKDRILEEVPEISEVGKFTVKNLRKLKQIVGKYSPYKFGKSDRGALENLSDADYNEAYGKVANILHDTVRKVSGKGADKLIRAEKQFTDIINSARHISKRITDAQTKFVSKTAQLAKDVQNPMDATSRMALDIVKGVRGNRGEVSSAQEAMSAFNRQQMLQNLIQHAASAATFGGAVGGLGGYLGSKVYGKRNQD